MKVRFLAPARQELDDAVIWYNEQADGLGQEFLDELDRAIRRSVAYPLSCPEIEPGLRRCLLALSLWTALRLGRRYLRCGGGSTLASRTAILVRSYEITPLT